MLAFIGVIQFDSFSKFNKKILWILLVISLIFRAQVYATTILAPNEPLWYWQWLWFFKWSEELDYIPWYRFIFFTVCMSLALLWTLLKNRKHNTT